MRSASQAERPRGLAGHVMGELMARLNRSMNRASVELLAPAPGERILELGFGHGATLALLLARVGPTGSVTGADPSDAMLTQARWRNRRALAEGRLHLHRATASAIPVTTASHDAALAVNCAQFWSDPAADLAEVRRVLRPGGRLVVTLRAHLEGGGALDAIAAGRERIEATRAALHSVGFVDLRSEPRDTRPAPCVCLLGRTTPGSLS